MNTFTLARPTDPRGLYHYMTDNRTPERDCRYGADSYVDAWALTTSAPHDVQILDDWYLSQDRVEAIKFISSWAEGATQ
jgi:hypothetical protein